MIKTYVILDGLQDIKLGRQLSADWAKAGFANTLDVAGQSARLWPAEKTDAAARGEFTEEEIDKAAIIARRFGVELRDRAGKSFAAENDLPALRAQVAYEYKCRLATGLVYGLPALALHYVAPFLAGGGGETARSMTFPWLFELILAGWVCIAAAWPILWQGALALRFGRLTGDLLTSLLIAVSFIPSAVGVIAMAFVSDPWFAAPGQPREAGPVPMFHVTVYIILLAVLQRWLMHRAAERTAGWSDIIPKPFGLVVAIWIALCAGTAVLQGTSASLAVGLLLSPVLGIACVNALSPGWLTAFPIFMFAIVMLIGPSQLNLQLYPYEVETAFGFGLLMTLMFIVGWKRLKKQGE